MSGASRASRSRAEAGLQCLRSAVVEADDIDRLGHMNVRIYGMHGLFGAKTLASQLGLPESRQTDTGALTAFTDLYTRHYREQLVGAPLEVWGGVLDASETKLRVYNELVNPELDELAATFVHTLQLQDRQTHAQVPFAPEMIESAKKAAIALPEHGRSRSVDADGAPPSLPLFEARARGLELLKPRIIEEDECDSDGLYRTDSFFDLAWRGEKADNSEIGEWIRELDDGRKIGWATMESRASMAEMPRVGTRVQSFGTIANIGRKSIYELCWIYDIDREVLLCTVSAVSVAFDIATRAAIDVPPAERERLGRQLQPDLL